VQGAARRISRQRDAEEFSGRGVTEERMHRHDAQVRPTQLLQLTWTIRQIHAVKRMVDVAGAQAQRVDAVPLCLRQSERDTDERSWEGWWGSHPVIMANTPAAGPCSPPICGQRAFSTAAPRIEICAKSRF